MSGPCVAPCRDGGSVALERTRYYVRQLVTPDDFTQDQLYFRERLKRHNRMLHGWGVVCGACVRTLRAGGTEVVVEPGYILGPFGDEIVIDREVTLDLRRMGGAELDGCCAEQLDPWCDDTRARCPDGEVYLAVRYQECEARPVRATSAPCGCGGGGTECQYSRIRDSYALKVLRELPATYVAPAAPVLSPCGPGGRARPCPPCPPEPWVILAAIRTNAQCAVAGIDCFRFRRYAQSYANFYITCVGHQFVPLGAAVAEHFVGRTITESALTMMDERAAVEGAQPTAYVTMKRADGRPLIVPAAFPVAEGETLREMLAREGDRTLVDPDSGTRLTLRALFERAKAPMGRKISNAASALSVLEGVTLEAAPAPAAAAPAAPAPAPAPEIGEPEPAERAVETPEIAELRRQDPAAIMNLPVAAAFAAFEERELGEAIVKAVGEMTLGEVSSMSREAFVRRAVSEVPRQRRKEARAAAGQFWSEARRIEEELPKARGE